jgi:hypothetical protein
MRILRFPLLICLLAGCRPDKGAVQPHGYHARAGNPANYRAIDSVIRLLRSGDVALRTGVDMTSVMLRGMNQRDPRFSHCGIVMIENGYPFVYHSIGGEDNPDSKLRRDSAAVFFRPSESERMGIARLELDPAELSRLKAVTRRYFEAGVPFDMDFDLLSDDRFYCAEFVCKSFQEALENQSLFTHSKTLNREYVGIDNIIDPAHASVICDLRYKL